jgi:D-3-phosphoglycerate dehydrogenase
VTTRPRILIAEPKGFSPAVVELLRERADVDVRAVAGDEIATVLDQYDVFWFRLAHRLDARLLETARRCRVIATPVTGIDHIDLEACRRRAIRVVSLKGEVEFLRDVRATAELTVSLMMALMRRLVPAAASVAAGQWDRDRFRGNELYEKTAGIIGVGRLGTLVGGYLHAFGMRVLGHDRTDFDAPGVEQVASLETLLEKSDVVSIHVDLNSTSRGLIGSAQIAQMRRGSWLVNTSRGGVLDEVALLSALESGQLAGAALDVLNGEPDVPPDHPVIRYARSHDNLLVVPHLGGNTVESFQKTELFLARRVLEALRS